MEKTEAIREYCIDRTLQMLHRTFDDPTAKPVDINDVIKIAKKLEDYIQGDEPNKTNS